MKNTFVYTAIAAMLYLTPFMAQAQEPPMDSLTPEQSAPPVTPPPPKPAWMEYKNPYVGEQNDLSNPNRSTEEIMSWTRDMTTNALTFTPEELNEKIAGLQKNFSKPGWVDYQVYMKDSRFIEMIGQKRYNASTIVDGDMVIKASGPMAGAYRWVVEVPLLVTFHEVNRAGVSMPVTSGNFRLKIQIGRVGKEEGKDGMKIDSWQMITTARRTR